MSAHASIDVGHRSRRALLAGALGALGAWAASAVSATRVRAEGEAVVVGGEYTTASSVTRIRNEANAQTVILAESGAGGVGLRGVSDTNSGVQGATNSGVGVSGTSTSSIGVQGFSGSSFGVYGSSDSSVGIRGFSSASMGVNGISDTSRGVWGLSDSNVGVYGLTNSGIGVYADAGVNGVYALETAGRVKLSTTGLATIPAGLTNVTVSPGVNVVAGSFVLLSPKANIGGRSLWFTTDPAADSFTIRMSSARGVNTRIAWLLLG